MWCHIAFHSQLVAPLFMSIKSKITDYIIFPAVSKAKSLGTTSVFTWLYSVSFKAKTFFIFEIFICATISNQPA